MKALALPATAALLLAVAGCGGSSGSSGTTTSEVAAAQLSGVPWVLASGLAVKNWQRTAPTATFKDGRVTGFGGCGTYDGAVKVTGQTVSIGAVTTTRAACPQPGVQVEQAYTAALKEASGWQVQGSALVLSGSDGKELLRFSVASPANSWKVTAVLKGDSLHAVLPGIPMTALIGQDGSIKGSAGCNTYTASGTIDRTAATISITKPTAGDKTCADDVMAQEQSYLAALPTAKRYLLAGRDLTLLSADGKRIVSLTRTS